MFRNSDCLDVDLVEILTHSSHSWMHKMSRGVFSLPTGFTQALGQ